MPQTEEAANTRMLCTVVPSGLEDFFLEIGEPVAPGVWLPPQEMGPDDQMRLKAIAERYGQKLYPPDYFDKLNAK